MEKLTDFLFIAQVMILAAILIRWSARRRVPGVAGLGLIGWLAAPIPVLHEPVDDRLIYLPRRDVVGRAVSDQG